MERNRSAKQDYKGDEPETHGDGDILKKSFRIVPFPADEFAQGRAVAFGAPGDIGDDGPFPQNCQHIHGGAMRILRRAHSKSAEVTPGAPRSDHGEQKNSMRRTGYC